MTVRLDQIERADAADIDAILALQLLNSSTNGGSLSVAFSREWLAGAIATMPVMVARRDGRLVGYALSSTIAAQMHVPIIQAMLRSCRIPQGAYLYGPVCVAQSERGRGLAGLLFGALRRQLLGRPAVTFIRSDNISSRRAHAKMGLRQAADFTHAGETYLVMACEPDEPPAENGTIEAAAQPAEDTAETLKP